MVNGPPTPPPSSATELDDAARSASQSEPATISNQLPVGVAPASRADFYQTVFPEVADLVAKGDYFSVVQCCERSDLNGDGDNSPTRLLITTPLVLAYLIVDDLAPARYALSRLPDNLVSHPLAKLLRNLLSATRDRKHTAVFSQAELLYSQAQKDEFIDPKLGSIVTLMITAFIESFRQRTFALLSKAYSSIPLPLAQIYMGWSSDQVLAGTQTTPPFVSLPAKRFVQAASNAGWLYDEGTKILSPPSDTAPFVSGSAATPGASSLQTFSLIASNVAQLEA